MESREIQFQSVPSALAEADAAYKALGARWAAFIFDAPCGVSIAVIGARPRYATGAKPNASVVAYEAAFEEFRGAAAGLYFATVRSQSLPRLARQQTHQGKRHAEIR